MSNLRTMVSVGVVLLLLKCDSTWGKTGNVGGRDNYYDGYGESSKGKGGPKSCKSSDRYSDIPCDEFDAVPTPQPRPSLPSPTIETGPTPSSPSDPSVPSEPTPTQTPTDDSPPSEPSSPPEPTSPLLSEPTSTTSPQPETLPSSESPPTSPSEPTTTSPSEPTPTSPSEPTPTSPSEPTPASPSEPTPTSTSESSPTDPPSPSDWVTSSVCKTDGGAYGSQSGSASLATFGYEIETRGSDVNLETEVLPAMEVSFNDYMLPALFPGTCSFRRLQFQLQRRKLAVVGLRADPYDTVDASAPCDFPLQADNSCNVVDGVITLLSDGELALVNQEIVRDTLKNGMENDAFLHIHPDIVRVSYREPADEGTPEPTDAPNENADIVDDGTSSTGREVNTVESGNDNNAVVIGTVLAAAAVAVLLLGALFVRRRRRGTDEQSSLLSGEPLDSLPSTPPRTV